MDVERVAIIVLDGVGIGGAPDAADYGDEGSNTLGNEQPASEVSFCHTAGSSGLVDSPRSWAFPRRPIRLAHSAACKSIRPGKTPHRPLGDRRHLARKAVSYVPQWIPSRYLESFEQRIGRRTLGNKPASGTEIIAELGEAHMQTGSPIVYTSADSVFQLAAHERVISRDELYDMCRIARELLQCEHGVGRVIARPFDGAPGSFYRTDGRRDFSLPPPEPTLLDRLIEDGVHVDAVGKISDIFAGRGISHATPAKETTRSSTT